MPESGYDPATIQAIIDRWNQGDVTAIEELLKNCMSRLSRLAQAKLRSFPNVHNVADTDDVLQGSLIRLLRTLNNVRVQTAKDFMCLASTNIRRELLDLARKTRTRRSFASNSLGDDNSTSPPLYASSHDDDLDQWIGFHEAVETLSVEEREVVGLVFYHGWTQAQIAELFSVSERTVRRWWMSACERLRKICGVPFIEENFQ